MRLPLYKVWVYTFYIRHSLADLEDILLSTIKKILTPDYAWSKIQIQTGQIVVIHGIKGGKISPRYRTPLVTGRC
jgi:hypothetical protein